MVELESIKVNLAKHWGDISNEALNQYLLVSVGKASLYPQATSQGVHQKTYNDLYIESLDLTMCITDCKKGEGDEQISYRDVRFFDSKQQKRSVNLRPGDVRFANYEHLDVRISDGLISFFYSIPQVKITPEFNVIDTDPHCTWGVWVDICNRKIGVIEPGYGGPKTVDNFINSVYEEYKEKRDIMKKWTAELSNEMIKNSEFSDVVCKLGLDKLESFDASQLLILMHMYVINESAELIIKHAKVRAVCIKLLTMLAGSSKDCDGYDVFMNYLRKADSAWGVIGVRDEYGAYLENYLETYAFDYLHVINIVERYEGILDRKKLDILVSLLGGRIDTDGTSTGHLLYLIKRGYSLEELNEYVSKLSKTQGLKASDAISLLYGTVNCTETLYPIRRKFFPNYLELANKMMSAKIKDLRDTNRLATGDACFDLGNFKYNPDLFSKLVKQKSRYEKKYDGFVVESVKSGELLVRACLDAHNDHRYLQYRKGKGKKEYKITLNGDKVVEIGPGLDKAHIKNILLWADEHDIIVPWRYRPY